MAAGATVANAQPEPHTLKLSCGGSVVAKSVTSVGGGVFVPGGPVPTSDTIVTESQRAARIQLELNGSSGRIHLTGPMVPMLNRGGENGWWPMYDVVVSDSQITGRFRLNFLDKPSVRIDRFTGDIEVTERVSGRRFNGTCEVSDITKRKF